jgi:hypothetical protein
MTAENFRSIFFSPRFFRVMNLPLSLICRLLAQQEEEKCEEKCLEAMTLEQTFSA